MNTPPAISASGLGLDDLRNRSVAVERATSTGTGPDEIPITRVTTKSRQT